MIPLIPISFGKPLMVSLLLLMASSVSSVALANEATALALSSKIPVARYSLIHPAPDAGQLDVFAVREPIRIPQDIDTVGDALTWLLKDSGYRLVSPQPLSDDTNALLQWPLPQAHRRFEFLPLKQVIELLIGPAYRVVHDPVHRQIAIERCRDPHAKNQPHTLIKGER